ncbi:methylglyoxal reductase (NADPH-dependent) gre2 [Tulasnella sp. 427]|nr:methylglyoxal reductase (NADPH-dependent) gre2 [Tulasnella sp. 427]
MPRKKADATAEAPAADVAAAEPVAPRRSGRNAGKEKPAPPPPAPKAPRKKRSAKDAEEAAPEEENKEEPAAKKAKPESKAAEEPAKPETKPEEAKPASKAAGSKPASKAAAKPASSKGKPASTKAKPASKAAAAPKSTEGAAKKADAIPEEKEDVEMADKEKEEKAAEAPAGAKPDTAKELQVGDVLPNLTLKNEKDQEVHIAELAKEKGVVFFLIPKADTLRSESKGKYLENLFKDQGDRFTYVIVEDIAKEGAFDKAVVGVDAVQHTASPFHLKAGDPQELIQPAVKGTVGVLESIKKYAPGVKRVVITSSVAAIVYDKGQSGVTYDEYDWNTESPTEVEQKGRDASPIHKYRASKVLAEKAAWDFVDKNKESIAFDLVTVNPPMVWGPIIHEVASVDQLNTSVAGFHRYTSNKTDPPLSDEQLKESYGNWCDVRDVAFVHSQALALPTAGGERFIVGSGGFTVQDILDALHASGDYPNVPKGNPGSGKDTVHNVYISGKAEQAFGFKLRTMAETVPETYASLKERGF